MPWIPGKQGTLEKHDLRGHTDTACWELITIKFMKKCRLHGNVKEN